MQELKSLSNQELLDLHKTITDFLKYLESEYKNVEKLGEENDKWSFKRYRS